MLQSVNGVSKSQSPSDGPQLFDLGYYWDRLAKYIDSHREDSRVLFEALQFAYDLHAGQRRKSGAPYISHPCAVAEILVRELRLQDPVVLAAALLHDVVEDVPSISIDDIERRFGNVVAELVDGCTKLTRYYLDRSALKDLTHSKIFLSASRRLGVLIIKLADRLHNLRTLHYLPIAKRQRIAQETLEVYAPIAAKLNIFPLKRELYHLALSYLYPRKSKKILHLTQGLLSIPEVMEVENMLQGILSHAGLPATIRSRLKGLGSYYNALKRTLDLSNAENQVDFTVVLDTDDVIRCYAALGVVSTTFVSVPRTIRDFISNPKNNGYRSLHVRVHLRGQNYLVKLRTPEMDRCATYGILCNWDPHKPLSDEHWMEVSELLRNIGEYGGAGSQRKALIRLSETEEIFVFTPKGDIYYFPVGSTVLDFAYRIHSDLGDYCSGALVNGQWQPPTRLLKDGDTVEIITSRKPLDPDPDVERLCKTPKARTAINKRLHQKRLDYAEQVGRQILMQELQRHGLPREVLEGANAQLIFEVINVESLSELFVRIGQDLLNPHLLLYYLLERKPYGPPEQSRRNASLPVPFHERNVLSVPRLDKAIHKFARCCNPYPGQENVVATLSERGVTFHHTGCADLLQRHDLLPLRLVDVHWDSEAQWRHLMLFEVHLFQQTPVTLFPYLARLPSHIRIQSIESRMDKTEQPFTQIVARFNSFRETQDFFSRLPSSSQPVLENYGKDLELQNE